MTSNPEATETWQPISWLPGDPQPRLSDGYRGVRADGRGGFEGIPDQTPIEETASRIARTVFCHASDRANRDRLEALLLMFADEIKRSAIEP